MASAPILPVIVNRSGGTASKAGDALEEQLRGAFASMGRRIALEIVPGDQVEQALDRHSDAPRIVVGGGDGTIGGAAARVANSRRELAVLPLGTRNHFARQLGIPRDLAEAARLAATGSAIAVDCATAGERTFINNASLGAYVDLVREREQTALPKTIASIVAGWRVLRRLRSRQFELTIDGERRAVRTPMLFIGNNRYEIPEGKPAVRDALDDGKLSVFALAPLSRPGLVRAALRVALGMPDMRSDFALQTTARTLRLEGTGKTGIALDGEELDLSLPLEIHIRPGALQVVAPHG
jgi:diacylglycerol kinase family enzyme